MSSGLPSPRLEQDRLTTLVFACAVLMIGGNLVAIRFINREIPPFWGAGARFALAAVMFYAITAYRRSSLPRGRGLVGAVLYGGLGIGLYFAFVYRGLVDVKAGYGQVLLSLAPLLTLLFAVAHRLERLRWAGVVGSLIAVAGVGVLFADQISADVPFLSMFMLVLAAACAAEGGIVLKLMPPADILATNAVAMTVGAIVLLALSFIFDEPHPLPRSGTTWIVFAYLATLGTFGPFVAYMHVMRTWSASAASYQFVLAPLVAVGLAATLLGETVTWGFFVGGALVLAGLYFGALRRGG